MLPTDIDDCVRRALQEDIGSGDLTGALIPPERQTRATIITREPAVLCGSAWVNASFRQLDPAVSVEWLAQDGAEIAAGVIVCRLSGSARVLLGGERVALNFLQLLSGTATIARSLVKKLAGTRTRLLDTRKTIPGLRAAQKYAVACGGGMNHRMGLYDAILLKENHIRAIGGITRALAEAGKTGRPVEIEVSSLSELQTALMAGATHIMLDNFDLKAVREAVKINSGRARLEVSGGIDPASLPELAETGVDFISMGSLTKNVHAIDFSMQFER